MANIYRQIGRKIRTIRKKEGLTQAQLGERSRITPDYVGRIERGQGAVTLETVARIASALDVPLRQLLDVQEIDSASRDEILRSIQAIIKRKDTEQLRGIYSILEAMEFR